MSAALLPEFQRRSGSLSAAVRERLRSEVMPILEELVASLRAGATPEEPSVWANMMMRWLRLQRLIVGVAGTELGVGRDDMVRDLHQTTVTAEFTTPDPKRKFALRFLQQALTSLEVLAGRHYGSAPNRSDQEQFDDFAAATSKVSALDLKPGSGLLEVLEFDATLTLALMARDWPADEFAKWAVLAATAGKNLQSVLAPAHAAPGLLARLEAKGSWDDWDDEEIEAELTPWPE